MKHQQYYYSKHIRNCQCFFAFLQKYFCGGRLRRAASLPPKESLTLRRGNAIL